jgi:hypothetical protein
MPVHQAAHSRGKPVLGCQALLQEPYEGRVVCGMHDMCVRLCRMAILLVRDNRHDKGIGAVRMEEIHQTRPGSRR